MTPNLPAEILAQIASHAVQRSTYAPGADRWEVEAQRKVALNNIRLVNSAFNEGAAAQLYHTLSVKVVPWDPELAVEHLKRLSGVANGDNARFVRHLNIELDTNMNPLLEHDVGEVPLWWTPSRKEWFDMQEQTANLIPAALARFTGLKSLRITLWIEGFEDEDSPVHPALRNILAECLLQPLPKLHTLKLDVEEAELWDGVPAAISTAFLDREKPFLFPCLRKLDLVSPQSADVFEVIGKLGNLRDLYVRPVGDDLLEWSGEGLSNLEQLKMRKFSLTATGFTKLLQRNPRLDFLLICDVNLHEGIWSQVLSYCKQMPNLMSLGARDCGYNPRGDNASLIPRNRSIPEERENQSLPPSRRFNSLARADNIAWIKLWAHLDRRLARAGRKKGPISTGFENMLSNQPGPTVDHYSDEVSKAKRQRLDPADRMPRAVPVAPWVRRAQREAEEESGVEVPNFAEVMKELEEEFEKCEWFNVRPLNPMSAAGKR